VSVPFDALGTRLRELLDEVQRSLYAQAKAFLESHTLSLSDRDDFFEKCRARAGMIDIPWCGRPECEAEVKAATGATTRNTRALQKAGAACVACGEPAKVNAYFAQSY
jgi:prolyl-tRNA synthetase